MGFKSIVFIFLFGSSFFSFAQTKSKQHYEIVTESNTDVSLYKKILDNAYLDSLRFLHERRTIEFLNAPIKVVIYSADELYTKYGKEVSEATIKKPYAARKVKFKITENNQIQVVAVN